MAIITKRESTGFLIKQRAFLKLYLITSIENGRSYGLQLLDDLQKGFEIFGFRPQASEIYRALYELEDEEGILEKKKIPMEGTKRKQIVVYQIKDKEAAKSYKKLVKADLDRCSGLLKKALEDNYG